MNRAIELSIAFLNAQPAGAARALEEMAADDGAAYLAQVPEPAITGVLGHMQPARAAALLQRLSPKKTATVLLGMSTNDRSVVLRALPEEARESVLATVSKRERAELRRYLAYPPATVGAWMDAPKAMFPPDAPVKNCLQQIRRLGKRLGSLVFVVDEKDKLRGWVHVDDLLNADDNALLEDAMRKDVITLAPQASLSAVMSLSAWDTSLSLPVIDRTRRLIGVLHFDDLREGLVADRGSDHGLQVNLILLHLVQALVVCLSGLLHIATAEPSRTNLARGREN